MKQFEEVIKVMEENEGYATLSYLYANVPMINWKTKTPFASIRRIVQDDRFFFKIKPGLWALKTFKNNLPIEVISLLESKTGEKNTEKFNHSYFQGLIVEIGNLKNYQTYVPPQDHNKRFLNKTLKDLVKLNSIYDFTYEKIIQKVRSIDVFWFNERNFPLYVFEIEHTTDFRNSLLKFLELRDFKINMKIVSPIERMKGYESKIKFSSFEPIRDQVKFISYDSVSNWHSKTYELMLTEQKIMG